MRPVCTTILCLLSSLKLNCWYVYRMWAGIDKVDGVPWRTIFIPALLGEPPVVVQRRDNNVSSMIL